MDYTAELKKRLNKTSDSSANKESDIRAKLAKVREEHPNTNNYKHNDSHTIIAEQAASEAAANEQIKYEAMSYDDKKKALKKEKSSAKKNKIVSAVGLLSADDSNRDALLRSYRKAKADYNNASDKLDALKKNEDTEKQNEIAQLITNDKQISSLVEKVYSNRETASEKNFVAAGTDDLSTAILSLKGVSDSDYDTSSQDEEINNAKEQLNSLLKEKGSSFNADELISYYSKKQNTIKSQETAKAFEKAAKEHPVETAAARVLTSPYAAMANVASTVGDTFLNGDYIYSSANTIQDARRGIKSGVEEEAATSAQEHNLPFADKDINIFGNNFGNVYSAMYDAIDMGAENAYTSLLMGGGLTGGITATTSAEKATQAAITASFTSSTMGEEVSELKGNGISIKDAYSQAGKNAIINFVTEMVGIPFLEGKGGAVGTVASEALEEVVGNALSNLDDVIRLQDEGEIISAYNKYIGEGKSEAEALSLTIKNLLADDIFAAGMAAFSSLGMAGTNAVSQRIGNNAAYRAEGKAIQQLGGTNAVINEGLNNRASSRAYQAAADLIANSEKDLSTGEVVGNVPNKKLGRLQQLNVRAADVRSFSDAVAGESNAESLINTFEKITSGKTVSRKAANEFMNNEQARTALSKITNIDTYTDSKSNKDIANELSKDYQAYTRNTFANRQTESADEARIKINRKLAEQSRVQSLNNDSSSSITLENGQVDTIDSINSISKEKVLLNTSNGNVVDAEQIEYNSPKTKQLYTSARAYPTNTAKTYVMGYSDNGYSGNVYDYNTGFNAVYMAQKQGKSLADAINLAHEQGSHITDMQAQLAYVAAQNDGVGKVSNAIKINETNLQTRKSFEKALNAKKTPGTTVIANRKTLSKAQRAEIELIDGFAKSADREIIVVADTEELGYGAANGFYKNGKIVLALNADGGLMSPYLGHELFHDLKITSKVKAQQLEDFVIERLKNTSDYDYDARVEDIIEKNNFKGTREQQIAQANEEIAANACFTVLSEKENFERLVKQDKSLAQKVRDFFADFIEKIKNALADISRRNAEYRALKDDITAKEKILEMFDEALNMSDTSIANDKNTTFYSAKESENSSIKQQLREYLDEIRKIGVVANVSYQKQGNKNNVRILANETFKQIGYKVDRQNFGVIEIGEKEINKGLNYLNSEAEFAALMTVPKVLKRGIEISAHSNHKDRGYETFTFAAPVAINGKTGNVAVVVRKTGKYKYYTHRILMPDGSEFVFEKNKDTEVTTVDVTTNKSSKRPTITSVSNNNVPQNDTSVNSNSMQDKPKYSLKEEAYIEAVKKGDISTAQKLVDEAAVQWGAITDNNGKPLKLYHGTTNRESTDIWNNASKTYDTKYKKFTVFKKQYDEQVGHFFNSDFDNAGGYGSTVYEVYLKMNNPLIIDCNNANYNAIKHKGQVKDTYEWAEYAKNNDYDGVIFTNIRDGVGYEYLETATTDYVVFDSSQIKSAEAVSFDDKENIIPLQKRFSYSWDIRYSLKEQPIDYNAILEENEELSEMNEDLKQMLELTSAENEKLKNEFKITDRHNNSNNAVDKVAVELRKQYSSNYGKSELVSRLSGLYDYIANAGTDIDMGYIWNTATGIAKNIIDKSVHKDTTIYDEYRELRNRIRNTQICVPDKVKNDFSDYDGFRRSNFGRLRLSDDGIELDSFYTDLASEYPEFFEAGVSKEQQLEALANFFSATSPVYYNASEEIADSMGYNMEQYANLIAGDIFDKYFDIPEVLTVAEKHKKEIDTLKLHYRNQISEMRQSYKERYEERLKEIKEVNKQRVSKLRADKAEALAKQKAHFEEVGKNASERRKKSKLRASIRKSLKKIATLGANPNKKKHIPNAIIDSVKALADAVTLDNSLKQDQQLSLRLNEFRNGFERVSNNTQYSIISEMYNDYIYDKIIELQQRAGEKTITELSVKDLEDINELLKMTVQSINNINRLFLKERNETIEAYANKISEELAPYKKENIRNGITKSLAYNSMKPEYFFRYIGSETLLDLYHELRKGEDTWAVDISEARDYALEIRKKYGWQKWDSKEIQKFETIDGEIELTLQERLGIFANSLGEHTKNHLYGGGFVYQKPKAKGIKELSKQRNDNSSHRLSIEDVEKIVDSLTAEQCSYVRDMIKYLSSDMAQKGNEIARELYDIDLFKESTYYPAKVNKEATHQSSKEVRAEKQIKNAGFTNATVKDAKQPLVLMDFDDVWASHVDEMSKYHAFVLPLENIDRVYNLYEVSPDYKYTSIKQGIKDAYGEKAITYIDDLIKDINGGVVQEAGTDIISKLTSKFKKNAVFASASVAIQQPSAIGRALSEIDAKYFVQTTGSGFNRKNYDEMKKYAPVAIIKEMGYFDTNMAQNTVDFLNNNDYNSIKEKAKAFVKDSSYRDEVLSFFASKADEITWTHIWNACKRETKAKYSNLNEEQMLEKAGERFTEVITKTQVYDSVFSRSGLMRSRDSGVKNAMAFMAEPTTSLNMLANAVIQAKRGTISKTKVARVFGSLMVASVLNSLLQSVVTAARADDDDKDWLEVYLAQLIPNFIDNINPLNQIAFVKDIFNIFQGYDIARADMNLFSDLYNAIHKLSSDKITITKKITGLVGAVSAFFGIPAKNVIRDVESAMNVGKDFFDDKKFSSDTALDMFKDEMNSVLGFKLFNTDLEIAVKAVEKGDSETYQEYADEIYASDDAYDLLYSVLKKYGYNSSQYTAAENKCVEVKKENGSKNPNPKTSMKNRALTEYAAAKKAKGIGAYDKYLVARQRCIDLYGSVENVEEALKKNEEEENKK